MCTRDPLYIYDVANPLPPLSEQDRARITGVALFGDPRFAGPGPDWAESAAAIEYKSPPLAQD